MSSATSPSPSPTLTPTVTATAASASPAAASFDGHPLPDWLPTLTAVLLLVGGLWLCVLGYRYFRRTLATVGFVAASSTVWLLTYDHLPSTLSSGGVLGVSVAVGFVAGVAGGVTCWYLKKLGVFVMGGSLGVLLAYVLNVAVFVRLVPASQANTPFIAGGVVLGVAFGALALRFMRVTVIIATATLGAFAALYGVGHFAGGFPDFDVASEVQSGSLPPGATYGYLAGICVLAVVGAVLQFRVTGLKQAKGGKDAAELEFDEADDLGLLTGKKRGSKRGDKRKRRKGRKSKKKGRADLLDDSLLREYDNAASGGYGYDEGGDEGGDGYDEGGGYDEESGNVQDGSADYYAEVDDAQPKKGWGVSFWGGAAATAAVSDQQIELQPPSRKGGRKAAPKEVEW